MLKRTPEPELMDDLEQAVAYDEADFSTTDADFVERFFRFCPEPRRVVDLGCGPGNLALRIAAGCTGAQVLAVDGSEAMLARGRARRVAALETRVRFAAHTLPDATLPQASFDAVVSNSLLHHLHDPGVLWATIAHVARPGAHVFVSDLRRPSSLATLAEESTRTKIATLSALGKIQMATTMSRLGRKPQSYGASDADRHDAGWV